MNKDAGRVVPEDFRAFVASHGPRVARACAEIAGNHQVAEALRDDVLAVVAARWRRWPVGSRSERALVRIQHLLQREARAQHATLHPGALDLRSPSQPPSAPFGAAGEQPEPSAQRYQDEAMEQLAAAAWLRAGRSRRALWTGAGVAGIAVLAVAVLLPPAPAREPPLPTEVPENVTILPAFDELMQGLTGWSDLPAYLLLGPSDVDDLPTLSEAPLARATLVAAANGGRVVVVGDEPMDEASTDPWRRVPPFERPQRRRLEHPALRGASLVATSLSPDGTMVALPRDDDLVLVDIRTGRIWTVDVGAIQPAVWEPVVTWLDSTRVMLPGLGGRVVDVAAHDVMPVDVDPFNVLSLRGYREPRLAQLVGVPESSETTEGPHTIRSLLLFWRDMDAAGNVEPVAGAGQVGVRHIVTGQPWLSAWVGPGFASPGLVVRACDPATLLLPSDVGTASAAVAAIDGRGNEIGTLVATDGRGLEVLGMIRAEDAQALVAVRSEERSVLVAWDPAGGTVTGVTYITADAEVSVADLLALCSHCSQVVVELDQETNAGTPVSASPTTS